MKSTKLAIFCVWLQCIEIFISPIACGDHKSENVPCKDLHFIAINLSIFNRILIKGKKDIGHHHK